MAAADWGWMARRVARAAAAAALAGALSVTGADAAEERRATIAGDAVSLSLGVGALWVSAGEFVDEGDRKLSQLDWSTDGAPVVSGALEWQAAERWRVYATGTMGLPADGFMRNTDWLDPTAGSGEDDWTDRSWHPDTDLDHYVALEAGLGYALVRSASTEVSLVAALAYTDVQWTAYGGDFIYSVGGFRDVSGSLPDGLKVITYRQRLPAVLAGFDGRSRSGPWTFALNAKAGLSVGAEARDDHWLRELVFRDDFDPAPMVKIGAKIGYALSPMADIVLSGSFDHRFRMSGDTTIEDTVTGDRSFVPDDAGGDFQAVDVSLGLVARF